MVNSLKELVEGIQDIVEFSLSDEIKKCVYTFDFGQDTRKAKDFPALFILSDQNGTIGENTNTVSLTMRFCDVSLSSNNSESKDKEIKSDMIQAASKLFDLMQVEGYFDGDLSIAYSPFDNELNNGLSGIDCTINFTLEKPCYNIILPTESITVDSTEITVDSTEITVDAT